MKFQAKAALFAALSGLAFASVPAQAGGLLGSVGSVATSATGALGATGSLGGLGGGITGAGSGSGVLGATLTGNGLQPGVGGALSRPLTAPLSQATGGAGRAWGTFEDAKGALTGKTQGLRTQVGQVTQRATGVSRLVGGKTGGASGGATGGLEQKLQQLPTETFVLSRQFNLPQTPTSSLTGKASGSASADGKRAKVAARANTEGVLSAR